MCKCTRSYLWCSSFLAARGSIARVRSQNHSIIISSVKLSPNSSLRFKSYHDVDITSVSFPWVWLVNRNPMYVIWAYVGCTRAWVKFDVDRRQIVLSEHRTRSPRDAQVPFSAQTLRQSTLPSSPHSWAFTINLASIFHLALPSFIHIHEERICPLHRGKLSLWLYLSN